MGESFVDSANRLALLYFIRPVLLAFVISIPIAWTAFMLSGLVMTGIALITICAQTLKAANANPVKNLRTE